MSSKMHASQSVVATVAAPVEAIRGIDISMLTETPVIHIQCIDSASAVQFVAAIRQAQLDHFAAKRRARRR